MSIAVQDPAYPVYVDGSVMIGATGEYNSDTEEFDGIEYMRCTSENDFFPDLSKAKRTDLIIFAHLTILQVLLQQKSNLKRWLILQKE